MFVAWKRQTPYDTWIVECMELSWRFRPLKRRFLPGNVYFEDGDRCCAGFTKQIPTEEPLGVEFELHEQQSTAERRSIVCGAPGCDCVFGDTPSYESHYDSCHRNVCGVCSRSFPSSRALDRHLEETHDSLFGVLAASSMAYQCIVSGCTQRFVSPSQRREHLIEIHQYPYDYVFLDKSEDKMEDSGACEAMETDSGGRGSRGDVNRVPDVISFGRGAKTLCGSHRQKRKGRKNKQTDGKQSDTDVM